MKGCKTVAEYAIRKWMAENGFVMSEFSVGMEGNKAVISDKTGDSMSVSYSPENKLVTVVS